MKLRKRWLHNPCPYRQADEECPVCDDPVCDCGNPGWTCACFNDPEEGEWLSMTTTT